MIHIHPEDGSSNSNKSIINFLKGLGTPLSVQIVPSTVHFTGDRWQNKVNSITLATFIASVLVKNEFFIIHYDADITYNDYTQHKFSLKFLAKESHFIKLKDKVKTIIHEIDPSLDGDKLTTHFIKMVTYVDFESWVFANKSQLLKYLDIKYHKNEMISSLIKLKICELENIRVSEISNFFVRKCGKRGKDVFNFDLMSNYPYDLALKNLKSFHVFYSTNVQTLKLNPSICKSKMKINSAFINMIKSAKVYLLELASKPRRHFID